MVFCGWYLLDYVSLDLWYLLLSSGLYFSTLSQNKCVDCLLFINVELQCFTRILAERGILHPRSWLRSFVWILYPSGATTLWMSLLVVQGISLSSYVLDPTHLQQTTKVWRWKQRHTFNIELAMMLMVNWSNSTNLCYLEKDINLRAGCQTRSTFERMLKEKPDSPWTYWFRRHFGWKSSKSHLFLFI